MMSFGLGDWLRVDGHPALVVSVNDKGETFVFKTSKRKVEKIKGEHVVEAPDLMVTSVKNLRDDDEEMDDVQTGLLETVGEWIKCRFYLSSDEGQTVITGFRFRKANTTAFEAIFDLEINGGCIIIWNWKIVQRKGKALAIYPPQSPPKDKKNKWFDQAHIAAWTEFRAAVLEAYKSQKEEVVS